MNDQKKIETYESLWAFCTSNNRLCLMPMKWQQLYSMLIDVQQKPDGSWIPSLPLILSGWEHSVPLQKYLVFQDHIKWAGDKNQLEEIGTFLRSLPESDWAHYGDF